MNDNLSRYETLIDGISQTYANGLEKSATAVLQAMLQTNWEIGQRIVEFEQEGKEKADYGLKLVKRISQDMTARHGRGFSHSNLVYMRAIYIAFPKLEMLHPKLSWWHYIELLKISDPLERSFYEKQTLHDGWTVRELQRQKSTLLFHRLAVGQDKAGILKLAQQGRIVEKPEDLLRNPFVLDFLKMPEPHHWNETDLEKKLIAQLQEFLLELGKGFAFIGRQYRIQIGDRFYRIDLVFYHRILKCFVLIDLKKEEVQHGDIGQMNFYLNYFREEENSEGDNEPIGIILAREKNELVVRYATMNIHANLLVGKYQLYLPNREELEAKLQSILEDEASALPENA